MQLIICQTFVQSRGQKGGLLYKIHVMQQHEQHEQHLKGSTDRPIGKQIVRLRRSEFFFQGHESKATESQASFHYWSVEAKPRSSLHVHCVCTSFLLHPSFALLLDVTGCEWGHKKKKLYNRLPFSLHPSIHGVIVSAL